MTEKTARIETVKGYITPLSTFAPHKEHSAHVAIVTDDAEYHVIPRGVGVELGRHISTYVEATGIITEEDNFLSMLIRSYHIDDAFDDAWYDDKDE